MASVSITGYRYYNAATSNAGLSGWKDWSTTKLNAYVGYNSSSKKRCIYAIKVKVSGNYIDNGNGLGMAISVPLMKTGSGASSGTLYARVHTSDPTGSNTPSGSIDSTLEATADSNNGKVYFSGLKQAVTQTSITVTYNFKKDTTYYILFGCSVTTSSVQVGYNSDDSFSASLVNYNDIQDGTATLSTPVDNGDNTFTISGKITEKDYNPYRTAFLYITINGSTPSDTNYEYMASSYNSNIDAGSFSLDFKLSSNCSYENPTVKALLVCNFDYNTKNISASGTVKHYSSAASPTINTLTTNSSEGKNTFNIKATIGTAGHNNPLKSAHLYYNINGTKPTTSSYYSKIEITSTKAGNAYSNTLDIPSGTSNIYAMVRCVYERTVTWSGSDCTVSDTDSTGTASKNIDAKYYGTITLPTVTITENNNNSFTFNITPAKNGENNEVTTTYAFGYDTNYSNNNGGSGFSVTGTSAVTKTHTLTTSGTSNTRTVYVKVTAKPAWQYDPNYNNGKGKDVTTSKAINQYLPPKTNASDITITTVKNSTDLSMKNTWNIAWTAATASNTPSQVAGYRIRIYKQGANEDAFSTIQLYSSDENNKLLSERGAVGNDRYYYDRTDTAVSMNMDPKMQNSPNADTIQIKSGDKIKVGILAYAVDGKTNKYIYGDGAIDSQAYSPVYTVKGNGVVQIRVNGVWKEGQVYVRVDGDWKEAESVNVKTADGWKESQ